MSSIKERIDDVVGRTDLRSFVASDLGPPKERGNGTFVFNCPTGKHTDSGASFTVWDDHYHCYGCSEHGDILNYIMFRMGKTLLEALNFLDGNEELPKYRRKEVHAEKKQVSIKMEDIERYHSNVGLVSEYLKSRKINDTTSYINMLGASRYSKTYVDSSGKEFRFETNRVAIPYLFGDTVYSINFRRDDLSASKCLKSVGDLNGIADMFGFLQNDLAKKQGVTPESLKREDVMRMAFGPRFYRPGSPVTAYGVHNVIFKRGNDLVYPRRPYCVLTEGEFNQLSCESLGFTCIATKPVERVNLRRLLQNVRIAFVAVDSDDAGQMYAEKLLRKMESDYTKIRLMTLPPGFNDMNDLHKAELLVQFLTSKPYYLERAM